MLALSLPDAFNPVAVGIIISCALAALLASRVQSVLIGSPARAWRRWCDRSRKAPPLETTPLRPDLSPAAADFAAATRHLLDELLHVQGRVGVWQDGRRPGLLERWLGYRTDDDYEPTIAFFGEVARWLQQASAVADDAGVEAPHVQHACARVRALVLDEDELAPRVEGIFVAIRALDAQFSTCSDSPYRDQCAARPAVPTRQTNADEEASSARERALSKHEDLIRRVAARYADDEAAREDLCQDIRLAVWLALPKHRGDASLSTYVRRIAQYCGARFSRRQPRLELIDDPIDETSDLIERLESAERRAALRTALSRLSSTHREAVELLLSGSSYREVAASLGISESNASVRIARARKQLRRQLVPVFA